MGWNIRTLRNAVKGEGSTRLNNYFFLLVLFGHLGISAEVKAI